MGKPRSPGRGDEQNRVLPSLQRQLRRPTCHRRFVWLLVAAFWTFFLVPKRRAVTREPLAPLVDHTWGSSLHRFQNHPLELQQYNARPWLSAKSLARRSDASTPIRVLVVTTEVPGLFKNGGIGTALLELSQLLAETPGFNVSMLLTHARKDFDAADRLQTEQKLGASGITLDYLEVHDGPPVYPPSWISDHAVGLYRKLQAQDGDFDVIHIPDNNGLGYFTTLAKHEGLAFAGTQIVVGMHGPEVDWAAMLNKKLPADRYAIEMGFYERTAVELADVSVSPSNYMLNFLATRGWRLPAQSFVIPNVVRLPPARATPSAADVPVREIVFFGRLEERKGIRIFTEAMDRLFANVSAPDFDALRRLKFTFVGRDTTDASTGVSIEEIVTESLSSLNDRLGGNLRWSVVSTLERDAAISYLQGAGRLAVIASLSDNSPSTVLECISNDVRFLATNVGGIPELIRAQDRDKVLFAAQPVALAERLRQIVVDPQASRTLGRAQMSQAAIEATSDWIALHHYLAKRNEDNLRAMQAFDEKRARPKVSVCVTHFERPHYLVQLLDSLAAQTYSNMEVIVVDDGSTSAQTQAELHRIEEEVLKPRGWRLKSISNSYLGEARNVGAKMMTGRYLLFLDDDDVLKPNYVEGILRVAQRTKADVLSTFLDVFHSEGNPLLLDDATLDRNTYMFTGQSLSLGVLENCFGSGNIFVSRSAFDRVGGFTTFRQIGAEDWEFYIRAALQGLKHLVVPEAWVFVREYKQGGSMKGTMDTWMSNFRAISPLLDDHRVVDLKLDLFVLQAMTQKNKETSLTSIDSTANFRLTQGHAGWFYSFQHADKPIGFARKSFVRKGEDARFHLSTTSDWECETDWPFIGDVSQHPYIAPGGKGVAAVRSFQAAEDMNTTLSVSYVARHDCGDGTELQVTHERADGTTETLMTRQTLRQPKGELLLKRTVEEGDCIHVAVLPLQTDMCDEVRVQAKLARVGNTETWIKRPAAITINP